MAQLALGRPVEELHHDPLPEEAQYLWEWFAELSNSRQSGGFGPNPISHLDMQAWASLKRLTLEPFEVDALRAIDAVYLAASNKKKPT